MEIKFFQTPIDEYEEDMESESAKEKKKEIEIYVKDEQYLSFSKCIEIKTIPLFNMY